MKSPIRLRCTPPTWAARAGGRKPGSRQAWSHLFDDPPAPFTNFAQCRWTCVGGLQAAQFRQRSDPRVFAVLHATTKPRGRGLVSAWDQGKGPAWRVGADSRIERAAGWQLSFFDELGARCDVWGADCDDALRRAFDGPRPAFEARDWRLEAVIAPGMPGALKRPAKPLTGARSRPRPRSLPGRR